MSPSEVSKDFEGPDLDPLSRASDRKILISFEVSRNVRDPTRYILIRTKITTSFINKCFKETKNDSVRNSLSYYAGESRWSFLVTQVPCKE